MHIVNHGEKVYTSSQKMYKVFPHVTCVYCYYCCLFSSRVEEMSLDPPLPRTSTIPRTKKYKIRKNSFLCTSESAYSLIFFSFFADMWFWQNICVPVRHLWRIARLDSEFCFNRYIAAIIITATFINNRLTIKCGYRICVRAFDYCCCF